MIPSTIAWAVWLGANTAGRLAREWKITKAQAASRLYRACRRCEIYQRSNFHRHAVFTAVGEP